MSLKNQHSKNKNLLLIIDAQYDFCNPKGSFFVSGAVKDIKTISKFIAKNLNEIHSIVITLDNHQINDISHPNFWRNKKGNTPSPFTQITHNEVVNGEWIPNNSLAQILSYLKILETQNEFSHFIWPEHCIVGTKGACLEEKIATSIDLWSRKTKRNYLTIVKGLNPLTEHFGVFEAQFARSEDKDTEFNQRLLNHIDKYENIYVVGEAKSHCVANTIKQLIKRSPAVLKKIIILEDTMSNFPNFEYIADNIYSEAKKLGATFIKNSEDVVMIEKTPII